MSSAAIVPENGPRPSIPVPKFIVHLHPAAGLYNYAADKASINKQRFKKSRVRFTDYTSRSVMRIEEQNV
jgi:hypothetical protein